ncbi:uncharacterized protein LOC116438855 isoform X2 [Corvus moneduloides]|uniref:uncharacterized protein LOC116438855 isoform X2 n=1 Tax=Corvus moneduloides TaxID=1196302 RepID=UPI001363671E|nr:uncharacterized protein LOC116438855 isoform X2 [Corvus moneduloides]
MTASASERGRSVWSEDPGLLRRRRRQPGDDRSFPEDAEGLNPWQSALDRVRGFPQEGRSPFVFVGQVQMVAVFQHCSLSLFLGCKARSQPSRSSEGGGPPARCPGLGCWQPGAAAAALDMPRNRDNEVFSGPPLESDEDLRYREQPRSRSLEAAATETDPGDCINIHGACVLISIEDGFCRLVFQKLSGGDKGKPFGIPGGNLKLA